MSLPQIPQIAGVPDIAAAWLISYWQCVLRKPRRARPMPNPVAPRVRKLDIEQGVLVVSVEALTPNDVADLSRALSTFRLRLPKEYGTFDVAGIRVQEFQTIAAA